MICAAPHHMKLASCVLGGTMKSIAARSIVVAVIMTAAMAVVVARAFAELPEVLENGNTAFETRASTTLNEFATASHVLACKKVVLTGTIPVTGAVTEMDIDMAECASRGLSCETLGEGKEGVVLMSASVRLVTIKLGTKLGLGALIELPNFGVHVECGAGAALILVKGSVIGGFANVVLEEHGGVALSLLPVKSEPIELAFEQEAGKQVITKCESPIASCTSAQSLKINFGKGEETGGLLTTAVMTLNAKVHVDY